MRDKYQCVHCGSWVDPVLGGESPVKHAGKEGSVGSPRSPGDHVNCCDECCYGDNACQKAKAKGGA